MVGEDVIGKWARTWRTDAYILFWWSNHNSRRTKETPRQHLTKVVADFTSRSWWKTVGSASRFVRHDA
jgi:hypothetical protein